jgi:multidrug resistance efflux pump
MRREGSGASAKQSGYVRELKVDFGSRVEKGQLMATLEIPELEAQLMQDAAAIKRDGEQVRRGQKPGCQSGSAVIIFRPNG